jgi:hypothetical protein
MGKAPRCPYRTVEKWLRQQTDIFVCRASARTLFVLGLVELYAHPARHLEVYHQTESGINYLTIKDHTTAS